MHIVFTTDNNYVRYLAVSMCSICESNRNADLTFHVVLSGEVSSQNKALVSDLAKKYDANIVFYSIDNDLLSILPAGKEGQPGHISVAAYYRLFLASILPESLDKVIYLDCDLIVEGSLEQMWETDISGHPVAAVPDMTESDLIHYRQLKYSPKLGYFNSGVLLINLKYWRENDCQGMFETFVNEHLDRIVYHDQDVLNYVFRESKILLPIKYNVQEGALYERVNISWEYDEQLEEALKSPGIIHYTTGQKPWNTGCKHPWKSEWYKYLELAGIKDFEPVKKKTKKTAMQIIRELFVFLGIVEPLFSYRKDLSL